LTKNYRPEALLSRYLENSGFSTASEEAAETNSIGGTKPGIDSINMVGEISIKHIQHYLTSGWPCAIMAP